MKCSQKTQDMIVKKEKFQRAQFTPLNPMNQKQADLLDALKYNTHAFLRFIRLQRKLKNKSLDNIENLLYDKYKVQ